jgi:hypothetical protein
MKWRPVGIGHAITEQIIPCVPTQWTPPLDLAQLLLISLSK